MASEYHAPVLLQACLEGLDIAPGGTYVDVTFGGGGHSRAILEKLDRNGRLIAFDRDRDAWANAALIGSQLSGNAAAFTLVRSDFRWVRNHLRFLEAIPIDGLLADLGVSSHQFDTDVRGFSFRFDGPLDMRMDHRADRTAARVIAESDERSLTEILRKYGEVEGAHRVARQILTVHSSRRIRTTKELVKALEPVAPRGKENSFLAQVFQALRIAVNDELTALEILLKQSASLMKPGGRLVIMSYHSLEDRLVKNYMRTGDPAGVEVKDIYGNVDRPFKPLSSKAIQPTDREIAGNPRARSARLRIAERQ